MHNWFDEIKYFAGKLTYLNEDPKARQYLLEIDYACRKIKHQLDYSIIQKTKLYQAEINSLNCQLKILYRLNQNLKRENKKLFQENQNLNKQVSLFELRNSPTLLKKENALLKYQIASTQQKKPTPLKKSRLFGW